MDLRKTLIVVLAVLLVFMMCYLTFIRNKKAKAAAKPAPAGVTAEKLSFSTDCPDYKKAIVKTGRTIRHGAAWGSLKGPYLMTGDLVIAKGAVFTVKPGVVIKFKKGASFICNGKMIAKGTKAKPIYFTSFNDDSVGGDTNCDNGAIKPAAGDYGKIVIKNRTSVKNCVFSYAESVE